MTIKSPAIAAGKDGDDKRARIFIVDGRCLLIMQIKRDALNLS